MAQSAKRGSASIAGVPFNVNPNSVRWNFSIKMTSEKTIGGKVIQLLGFEMSDLVIDGSFGGDAVANQDAFFQQIGKIAQDQVPVLGKTAAKPVRFLWPEQGWDFWVFIKALLQPGAANSIETSEKLHAPRYQLTLFVYEDNGDIVRVAGSSAQAKYLARFSAGLGWSQSEWNGPQTVQDLEEQLSGNTVQEYLFSHYGLLDPIPTATSPNVIASGPL